jgi:hypothetical protein
VVPGAFSCTSNWKASDDIKSGWKTVQKKEYSAGMVKLSFWFQEFRKVAGMIRVGITMDEIKEKCLGENLFGAPTRLRAEQVWHTISSRVRSLDQSFFPLFTQGDIAAQKIICLTSILLSDSPGKEAQSIGN